MKKTTIDAILNGNKDRRVILTTANGFRYSGYIKVCTDSDMILYDRMIGEIAISIDDIKTLHAYTL